jgi:DTW domain-containing protein YfiP
LLTVRRRCLPCSLKTEACLLYSAGQIAAACIWLALKLLREDTHIYTPQGRLWWVAEGVTEEQLQGEAWEADAALRVAAHAAAMAITVL